MAISWTYKQVSIAEMYMMLDVLSPERIDCDPVGQRPDCESQSKKRGIIDTVLGGYDFGEIKLRELNDNSEYKYCSIDGGHRKRAIRDFILNKFTTSAKTVARIGDRIIDVGHRLYKDLPQEVKEQFLMYSIRFTIYGKEMTDEEAGESFRRVNISTDVNHQEMLNSYENNLVSKFVREISRPIRGLNNNPHVLFERSKNKKGEDTQSYFQTFTTRLRDDEYVTRLLVMLNKDKNDANYLTCSNDESEKYYIENGNVVSGNWVKNASTLKSQSKKVLSALDFIHKFAEARIKAFNSGLSNQEMVLISRLYTHWVKEYGEGCFKITDWNTFYTEFKLAMNCFVGEFATRKEMFVDDKGNRAVSTCFVGYLTVHNNQKKSKQSVDWFLEEFNMDDAGVIILDPVRTFSRDIREQVWIKQDKKCWVTGLPLAFEDAEAGHIVAHANGGRTTVENCVIVHKDENSAMSSTDATLYKIMRQSQKAA